MRIKSFTELVDRNKEDRIISNILINNINLYQPCFKIGYKSVMLNEILPLSKFVVKERVLRANNLLKLMNDSNLTPFETSILSNGNIERLVFPPILEKINGQYYIFDGVHRVYSAMGQNIQQIKCIYIDTLNSLPLPCSPSSWDDIRIIDNSRPKEEVLHNLNLSYFRPLTKLFNSDLFIFNDKIELLNFINRYN